MNKISELSASVRTWWVTLTWKSLASTLFNVFITVSLAQFLSLMLCLTGVFSQSLTQFHNISTPTIQNFIMYALIATLYFPLFVIQKLVLKKAWNTPWYIYPLISLCDAMGNYLVVKAYNFTTITSIQLLDCLSIPNVLILSFLFLRRRYGVVHFVGVFLCLVGVIVVIVGEAKITKDRIAFDKKGLIGDALCIAGSVCYAISNVAQEAVILKKHQAKAQTSAEVSVEERDETVAELTPAYSSDDMPDSTEENYRSDGMVVDESREQREPQSNMSLMALADNMIEYLGMTTVFGAIFSILIMLIVERQEISVYTQKQPVSVYLYLGGFSLSMFAFSTLVPILLYRASATFMNLSFLSSDLWALVVSLLVFGGRGVTWYWGTATVLVVAGIVVYHLRGDGYREAKTKDVTQLHEEVQE